MISRLQSYWQYLTSDPLGFLLYAVYFTAAILVSLILHEVAHGWVAYRCGDPTAKMFGRLTLDPRKHLDPLGTLCMVLFGFGWARPVPVNPRNFRDYRRDDLLVSLAGICMNLTICIVSTALSVIVTRFMWNAETLAYYQGRWDFLISPFSGIGSAIAFSSADGLLPYLSRPWLLYVQRLLIMLSFYNVALAVFNLIPIPPLDGYHVLNDVLLRGRFQLNRDTFRIAQTVLMVLCLTGALGGFLSTVDRAVYEAVLHLFLLVMGGA